MTTGKLDEFRELSRNRTTDPGKCVLARRMEQLEDEQDRADLLLALSNEQTGSRTIQRWFARRDIRIDDSAIGKHRRQECCCERR